jgi:spermidine synthase
MFARPIALLLTAVTGFTGLVYEVTWQKLLATLLGSNSEATAAVLGLFLGGLAVGYALFGALTRRIVDRANAQGRPARLLWPYGLVEGAIGVWALALPLLFTVARAASIWIPVGHDALSFGLDVVLSALLIGPPAVLMGATIPILTQALSRDIEDATRLHAEVYACNTIGAFAGALAAGYWLIAQFGLVGTLYAMGTLNLSAGACFLWLSRRVETRRPAPSPEAEPATPPNFPVYALVAILVGFAMMSVQTVSMRVGANAFGASHYTFAMVVAAFVLCIALGSFAVAALPQVPRALLLADLWALAGALLLLYLWLPDATYWVHVLRTLFRNQPEGFFVYQFLCFLGVLAALSPAVVLSGATLPLLFHDLRREVGGLGDVAGHLYSWNTLGSLLGALLGGYALLFVLDLHHVFRLAIFAIVVSALALSALTLRATRLARAAFALGGGAVLAVAIAALDDWSPERLSAGLFRNRDAIHNTYDGADVFFENYKQGSLLFYDDDPVASISVKAFDIRGERSVSLVTNGKSDSGLPGDDLTTGMLGLLPALLAERADRAFVIGYGTGLTAGILASLDSMEEVVVAEISPAVIDAAPLFDFANLEASLNPKVRIARGDAYRTLQRSEGRFDVISSEPSNPWVVGVEMLYSEEFLQAARERLAPGGVHCQWFHSYETDRATLELILRTYAAVFPYVSVWYGQSTDLLLLGANEGEAFTDVERLARRAARPDFRVALERIGIDGMPALLAHELLPVGVVHALELEGPLHTLRHPRLSDLAVRAFFAGDVATLPTGALPNAERVGRDASLWRRWIRRGGDAEARVGEDERARLVRQTCRWRLRECATLLAEWRHEVPQSPLRDGLERELRRRQPAPSLALASALTHLYADDGAERTFNAREVHRLARYYESQFHYTAPFSRRVLARLFDDCTDLEGDPGGCRRARAEAERTLGALQDGP